MKIDIAFLMLILSSSLIFINANLIFIKESENDSNNSVTRYRLHYYPRPTSYDIQLISNIKAYDTEVSNFFCEIVVNIDVFFPTQNITLHVLQPYVRELESILIKRDKPQEIYKPSECIYDERTNILNFFFTTELSPNSYTLKMKFNGVYVEEGLFISYTNIGKLDRMMSLGTHFQTIGARGVFPCWDEPSMRAKFTINVKHHKSMMVLSNTPINNTILDKDNMQWTHFDTTDVIPSYLVAIVISNLQYLNEDNKTETFNKWYGQQHLAKYYKFAQAVAEKVWLYSACLWKNYQRIPKVNHVVINGFREDSIQKWGLVLYRETDIIYDERLYPAANKIKIMRLVAREMIHQWSCNLGIPAWWSYLWLNTGIAMLVGTYMINEAFPKSHMLDLFLVQYRHESLYLDTHFMESLTEIDSFLEANSRTAFCRYIKAPVILHMLQYVVSESTFWKAIRIYFYEQNVGVKVLDDFWNAMKTALNNTSLSKKLKLEVKQVMGTWIQQIHYPVLNVKLDKNNKNVTISVDNTNIKSLYQGNWWIPVTYTTQTKPNFKKPFRGKWIKSVLNNVSMITFSLENKEHGWLIVNLKQAGYYRVNYDLNIWQRIAHALNSRRYTKIHVLNRAQIIDDAFHFMVAGQLNASMFWNITTYLRQESNYIAWYAMFKVFEYISSVLPLREKKADEIKDHMYRMLDALLEEIGYDEYLNDDDLSKCLRQEAIKWACVIGVTRCKERATEIFEIHLKEPLTHIMLPWWKDWIYCTGAITITNTINWNMIYDVSPETFDTNMLEYMACNEYYTAIDMYSTLIKKEVNEINNVRLVTLLNRFLSTIARHARKEDRLSYSLIQLKKARPKEISMIVLLANVINHVYSKDQLDAINYFVQADTKRELQLPLIPYIKQKTDIRWSQIERQISYLEKLL